jgi:hypothetical protein
MLFIAIFFSIVFITINIVLLIINQRMHKIQYILLSILAITSFSYLAFRINPPLGWDLWHHFDEINRIRNGGLDYAFNFGKYKDLPVISILFWLISLTNNNGYLTFIVVLIDFAIYLYILFDVLKRYPKLSGRFIGTSFFLFCALINIVHAVSGIRNVLAFCIAGLAVYILHQKGFWKTGIILLFTAIMIHPSAIVFVLITILSRVVPLWFGIIFSIIWTNFNALISSFLLQSNLAIFQQIGSLMSIYEPNSGYLDPRVLIVNIIYIVLFLLYLFKAYNRSHNSKIIKFQIMYSFLILGSIATPVIFTRLIYGLAIIVIPSLVDLFSNKSYLVRNITFTLCTIYYIGILAFHGLEFFLALK